MVVRWSLKQLFVLLLLFVGVSIESSSQPAPGASARDRIIRAEKPSIGDDHEPPAVHIVRISLANRPIDINKPFSADDQWLKNLQITIRNVGKSKIHCVGVAFGLLEAIDTKLEIYQSWPWGIGFYRGDCGSKEFLSDDKSLALKPGQEMILDFGDVSSIDLRLVEKMGKLAKAVFKGNALVGFKRGKPVMRPLSFNAETTYLDDRPY